MLHAFNYFNSNVNSSFHCVLQLVEGLHILTYAVPSTNWGGFGESKGRAYRSL